MSTRSENTDPGAANTAQPTSTTGGPSRNDCGRRCADGRRPRRRWPIRLGLLTLVLVLAAMACHGHGPRHGFGGPHLSEARVERMVGHMVTDATDAQKTQLTAITGDAYRKLAPLKTQADQARHQLALLLAAPKVDRVALEDLRVRQLSLADQASRIVSTRLADAADVLTPAQRTELVQQFERHFEP